MAMTTAQHQDKWSLYDSGDEELDMNIPVQVLHDRHPYFPPPPTAAKTTARPLVRGMRRPIEEIPPLPPLPPAFATQPPPPIPPASPMSVTGTSQRKTLLQRIEGWWDLGLLEKRQTLFGGKSG